MLLDEWLAMSDKQLKEVDDKLQILTLLLLVIQSIDGREKKKNYNC